MLPTFLVVGAAKSGTPQMAGLRPTIPASVPAAAAGAQGTSADVGVAVVGSTSNVLDKNPDARMAPAGGAAAAPGPGAGGGAANAAGTPTGAGGTNAAGGSGATATADSKGGEQTAAAANQPLPSNHVVKQKKSKKPPKKSAKKSKKPQLQDQQQQQQQPTGQSGSALPAPKQ